MATASLKDRTRMNKRLLGLQALQIYGANLTSQFSNNLDGCLPTKKAIGLLNWYV
jgi:hypothetical protein